MAYQLGLKAPVPGAIPLRLATYLDFMKLPTPPAVFGHYDLIDNWEMLGNDEWGDCAFAGACHQEMLWTKEGGHEADFNSPVDGFDNAALANYGAVTGFDPSDGPSGDNPTDQGTAISDLADYWAHSGLVDSDGTRHKVAAIVDLNPGDLRELWVATYLFQSVGLGFAVPQSAIQQAQQGEVWDVVPGSPIVGGHYVPSVGRVDGGNGMVVTWGQLQEFTPRFYQKYNNQGIVCLSEEMLVNMKSVDGFDDKTLRADLRAL
jgi:hypothetical protein